MTLKSQLTAQIGKTGPLNLAEFMSACLSDSEFGYYNRSDAIGANAAFTTAPEMTQMFGELIGLYLAQSWLDQNSPQPFTLAELGPGRGIMMSDILRATSKIAGFRDAADLVFLESSPSLQKIQSARLSEFEPRWIKDIRELPHQPLFLVANEFFDALPIRQFRRTRTGWSEIFVDKMNDELRFCEIPAASEANTLQHREHDTVIDDIVEIRTMADSMIDQISKRISRHKGTALIIDYGDIQSRGDTLQAVKDHAYTDSLAEPGEADLSAHVDFGALREAARHVSCSEMLELRIWLHRMGIAQRAEILAKSMSGEVLRQHRASYVRLTNPEEMGSHFKVMALYPNEGLLPPGFSL